MSTLFNIRPSQELPDLRGYPRPDDRTMYVWHAECPTCGAPLRLSVDCSAGPPREVGTECEVCFALPVWHVDWWYAVEVTELLRNDRDWSKKR